MKLKEKNVLIKMAESLSDKELEAAYYDAVYDSLGSQADRMVELDYAEADIKERIALLPSLVLRESLL